jgi:pyrroline-5-carboxylate reductase
MTSLPATTQSSETHRLGFIGWGAQSAAFWEAALGGDTAPSEHTPLFVPDGQGAADSPLHPVPTVEALFTACDMIVMELPPQQVKLIMPMIRLSITDRHILVLLGPGWSVDSMLRQLNDRKLVRCQVLPMGERHAPLMAYFTTAFVEAGEVAAFRGLFAHVDHALEVSSEREFQVMQSLAAVAPAAFYTIMDALADGALMLGLSRKQALRLIAALLSNAAAQVLEDGAHPALLREEALQSGAAASGIVELESAGIRGVMMRTLERAMAHTRGSSIQQTKEEE